MFDCTKCIYYNEETVIYVDVHELCEMGFCMLCMHKTYDNCFKFKQKEEKITL